MVVDYSKAVFYKLCCKDPRIKEIYVGSTCAFRARKAAHKGSCCIDTRSNHNFPVYQYMREHGGWENWDMVEIERKTCVDKRESGVRERYWVETLGATLNRQVPTRTRNQYYADNKEGILEIRRKYEEDNKEDLLEIRRKYRHNNKEKINRRQNQLYHRKVYVCECGGKVRNSPSIVKKHLESAIHKRHTHPPLKQYVCECGSTIGNYPSKLKRHFVSKKHQEFLNSK